MKTLRGVLVVLLSAFGLVALGSATAHACSCVGGGPRDYTTWADVVVHARVVDVSGPMAGGADTVRYLVEVDRVYKGKATERLVFGSASNSAACGLEGVHVDDRKVFFLSRTQGEDWEPDTPLAANLCGGSGLVSPEQMQRLTGAGAAPRSDASPVAGPAAGPVTRDPEPGGPSRLWPTSAEVTAYAVGGTVLLLLAGGAWVLVRRRSLARR